MAAREALAGEAETEARQETAAAAARKILPKPQAMEALYLQAVSSVKIIPQDLSNIPGHPAMSRRREVTEVPQGRPARAAREVTAEEYQEQETEVMVAPVSLAVPGALAARVMQADSWEPTLRPAVLIRVTLRATSR
jgi:hypothetical protein